MTDLRRCPGCRRSPGTCWILPCLVLERALAAGDGAVQAWGRKAGIEVRPKSELRVPPDCGIVPSADASRVHTARGGVAFVTRDTDGLFYVWHVQRGEVGWLYAYRLRTPAVAKCRQLGRDFGKPATAKGMAR